MENTHRIPTPGQMGFSKLAQRNVILAFLVAMFSAITLLSDYIVRQQKEHKTERERIELEKTQCLERARSDTEKLMREQVELAQKLAVVNQELRELKDYIKYLQKNKKKK